MENTDLIRTGAKRQGDHLHIRGEHQILIEIGKKQSGSSPHTWRTPKPISDLRMTDRIISTYVENTIVLKTMKTYYKDHLHIRGEHSIGAATTSVGLGSSPHTWRTP